MTSQEDPTEDFLLTVKRLEEDSRALLVQTTELRKRIAQLEVAIAFTEE